MLGGILHFYSNFNRTFCKETVEILIRRRILQHLIWVCTACLCPTNRTLGLYIYSYIAARLVMICLKNIINIFPLVLFWNFHPNQLLGLRQVNKATFFRITPVLTTKGCILRRKLPLRKTIGGSKDRTSDLLISEPANGLMQEYVNNTKTFVLHSSKTFVSNTS